MNNVKENNMFRIHPCDYLLPVFYKQQTKCFTIARTFDKNKGAVVFDF